MKNTEVYGGRSQDETLSREIVGLAMKVHRALGSGFLEGVYRNALTVELRRAKISFELHPTLSVLYEGVEVGVFQADLIIDRRLVVELKSAEKLVPAHAAQLVNYLVATKIESGLLLNFGSSNLEFRTKTLHYRKSEEEIDLHV